MPDCKNIKLRDNVKIIIVIAIAINIKGGF